MKKLDKHYTNNNISKRLVDLIDQSKYDIIVEPSAGDGSICEYLDKSKMIAIDISPEQSYIRKMDFFDFTVDNKSGSIITIGNPPFGYRAQKAVEFFNHAATYSDVISFILPRSFRKAYVINQLHKNFHMIHDENVDVGSFASGTEARCCIQIWEKRLNVRKKIVLPKKTKDFDVISQGKGFDISSANYAIRRTGYSTNVGELVLSVDAKPPGQFIFLKVDCVDVVNRLRKIQPLLYKYSYDATAMSPTFAVGELIAIYEQEGYII